MQIIYKYPCGWKEFMLSLHHLDVPEENLPTEQTDGHTHIMSVCWPLEN